MQIDLMVNYDLSGIVSGPLSTMARFSQDLLTTSMYVCTYDPIEVVI